MAQRKPNKDSVAIWAPGLQSPTRLDALSTGNSKEQEEKQDNTNGQLVYDAPAQPAGLAAQSVCACDKIPKIVTLVTRTKKKNNMFDGRDVATGRDRKWLVWEEQAHVQMNELGRGIPTIERLVGKCLIWLE